MAIPKGCWTGGPDAYQLASNARDPLHAYLDGEINTYERLALRQIVETAEVEKMGDKTFLVACVSTALLEILATFEANREDLEDSEVDLEHDGTEPQHDN